MQERSKRPIDVLRHKGPNKGRRVHHQRAGQMLVVMAVSMTILLVLAAYMVNLCFLQRTHGELGGVVDLAAEAAIDAYQQSKSVAAGRQAAESVAAGNEVQGKPLKLGEDGVQFGRMAKQQGQWQFQAESYPINASRVYAKVAAGDNPASKLLRLAKQKVRFDLDRWTVAMQRERDIAMVVDRSSSMVYSELELLPPLDLTGVLPAPMDAPLGWQWCMQAPLESKWVAVVLGVELFLLELPLTGAAEQVGLVSFADTATQELPLSTDLPPIVTRLLQLTKAFCGGASDKEEAIRAGIAMLQDPQRARPDAAKIIVLISGSPTEAGSPLPAAQSAALNGIQVHTISYGDEADQSLMRQIASDGQGRHIHVDDRRELAAALKQLARDVPITVISSE